MKISQLIEHLQKLQAEFGDLDCKDDYNDLLDTPIAMNKEGLQILTKDDEDGPATHVFVSSR